MPKEYLDRVVLVTGAAQGIGKVLAQTFGLAGAKVVLADIQEDLGISAVKAFSEMGIQAHFVRVDLEKESEIESMVEDTVKVFGGLDVLVNNARVPLSKKEFPASLLDWDRGMAVMLKAPAFASGFALPYLESGGVGSIINISSINGFLISAQPLTYHIAKASIVQLTRHLAVELAPKKIRVNAICPGLVDIEDRTVMLSEDPENKFIIENTVPLGRAANPKEIADLALFLASQKASYITGQSYTIDGGMTLLDQFAVAKKVLESK